jgi:hypothetical protein
LLDKNIIEFIPLSKEAERVVPPPMPAKNYIPEWYKNIPGFNPKNMQFTDAGRLSNTSVKMCMPFLDSLTTGYIVETWTDIHFSFKKDKLSFNFPAGPEIIKVRSDKASINLESDYYPVEFVWQEQWDVKTPKGWSVIYTHPFNTLDLPFTTCSAIIDSDNYYHTATGQYPFFLKNGFEGLIPAGTPMYQIIPFKRSDWKSKIVEFDEKSIDKRHHQMARKFYGVYRDNFWVKKKYE